MLILALILKREQGIGSREKGVGSRE